MRLLFLTFWAILPLSLLAKNSDFASKNSDIRLKTTEISAETSEISSKTTEIFAKTSTSSTTLSIPAATTAPSSPLAAEISSSPHTNSATVPHEDVHPSSASLYLPGLVERTYLLGVGHNHVFDSYLSPLDYQGLTLSLTRIGERTLRRAQGRWSQMTLFDLNASHLKNPVRNATTWDGELQFNYGQHYHLLPHSSWDVALGALAAAHLGGTYNMRNGNNPGQVRMAIDLSFSAIVKRQFALWGRQWNWRTQCDVPLVGAFFTPHYGQSYYEIFNLRHTNANILVSHPFNAPSLRFITTLSLPLGRSSLTFGYKADVRQSEAHHLKRHAWNHTFVIGYSRTLQFLKR